MCLGLFYGLKYSLSWYMFCGHLIRMCFLLLSGVFYKCFIYVDYILLVDSVVEFFYTLAGFLPRYSINSWERDVEVSTIFVDLSVSPFRLYQFLALHILQLSAAYTFKVAVFSWWVDTFCHYIMSFSVSSNSLCSEFYFYLILT